MSGHQAVGIQTCHDAWLPNTRRLELRGGYYTTVLKTVSTCQAFEVVSDLAMKRPKCHVNATLSQIARSDGPENPCRSPAERCKSSSVETWGRGPDNSRDLRIGDVVCYNLRELREVPRIPLLGPAALLGSHLPHLATLPRQKDLAGPFGRQIRGSRHASCQDARTRIAKVFIFLRKSC